MFDGTLRFVEEFGKFHLLSGEPRKAFDSFQSASRLSITIESHFQLALIAAELGRSDVRDATVERICRDFKSKEPRMTRLFEMYRDVLARGGEGRLDLKALDQLVAVEAPATRGRLALAAARILASRGDREGAAVYLNRCIDSPDPDRWTRAIAREILRGWGRK